MCQTTGGSEVQPVCSLLQTSLASHYKIIKFLSKLFDSFTWIYFLRVAGAFSGNSLEF